MRKNTNIKMSSVIMGLSSALDLVNWFIVDHHRQVTSFAVKIAAEMGFSEEDKSTIAFAAALHDIGAISFNEKFNLTFDAENVMRHAELGHHLLQNFRPFLKAAELVRYHHYPWKDGEGVEHNGHRVPRGSHILHLADRAAVLLSKDEHVLKQSKSICQRIRQESGRLFVPEVAEAFLHLADRECFWLDTAYPSSNLGIENSSSWNIELDLDVLLQMSELFRMIIDFRSPHTATHSKDVAVLAESIARWRPAEGAAPFGRAICAKSGYGLPGPRESMDTAALILSVELAALTTADPAGARPAAGLVARHQPLALASFLVEAVVALPLVLPPTVLGFYLLIGLGPRSPAGRLFEAVAGHPFPFSFAGLLLASVLYSLPFAVQPFAGALAGVDRRLVEASHTLGVSPPGHLLPGHAAARLARACWPARC